MERYFCRTEDGSNTLFVPEIQQHYHSIHGAVNESIHVFINAGLLPLIETNSSLHVLEIGMGTGLNVALTEFYSRSQGTIYYTAIEAYPLTAEEIVQLNYNDVFLQISKDIMLKIHSSTFDNSFFSVRENFFLKPIYKKLQEVNFENDEFDLVYFDAFSPDVQPELWELEIFSKIYNAMKIGGLLCTYCAKGIVRRRMEEVGFKVERLTGFAGKREMLRGIK